MLNFQFPYPTQQEPSTALPLSPLFPLLSSCSYKRRPLPYALCHSQTLMVACASPRENGSFRRLGVASAWFRWHHVPGAFKDTVALGTTDACT